MLKAISRVGWVGILKTRTRGGCVGMLKLNFWPWTRCLLSEALCQSLSWLESSGRCSNEPVTGAA